jgi:hypothetical protein
VIDLQSELCRYRQIDDGTAGYVFKPLRRSEHDANELLLEMKAGEINFGCDGFFQLRSRIPRITGVWSPDIPWLAEPVLKLDPGTRLITITPTGTGGWEYEHTWIAGGRLFFQPRKKCFSAPPGLSLTDAVWAFKPVTYQSAQLTFTISKHLWFTRKPGGCITLAFEDVRGSIFIGPESVRFTGLPEFVFDESGALIVRSDGDTGVEYEVTAVPSRGAVLRIMFEPISYTSMGTRPVKQGSTDKVCPICFDSFKAGETAAETPCKHHFHLNCLLRWGKRECPYCRGSLE